MFSNGEYLFCYRDKNGYKGLWYPRRQAPFGQIKLADEDFEIDLDLMKGAGEKGYIIATNPLTDGEEWTPLAPGHLTVFRRGEKVFPIIDEVSNEEIMNALRHIRMASILYCSAKKRAEIDALLEEIEEKAWDH